MLLKEKLVTKLKTLEKMRMDLVAGESLDRNSMATLTAIETQNRCGQYP